MKQAVRKHLRDVAALLALVALGLGVVTYILSEQGFRFPLIEEAPFEIEAELAEAGGVTPGQNQAVRIAFVRVGEVADVKLRNGRALLKLQIRPEYADRIRRDASALLRPKTGLEDMFLDIDPGSENAERIEEGGTIPISNTLPDVDSEEILAALDDDARNYLTLLLNGAGKGLDGRGGDLRQVLKRLAPLHRDLARVNGAFARQRRKLARLVHNYGELTDRLGDDDQELTRLVTASRSVFDAFASQDTDISAAVARLPGALRETESTLRKVDTFADVLAPSLESLRAPIRRLPDANEALRDLARSSTGTVRTQIRPFVRRAKPWLEDLQPAATALRNASPDLRGALEELNRFGNMAGHNPGGAEPLSGDLARDRNREEGYLYWIAWLVQNTNSLFSTSDASGAFRRANFSVSCSTLRGIVAAQPFAEEVLGVTELLGDAGLCPRTGGEPLLPPLPELPELPELPLPVPPGVGDLLPGAAASKGKGK